MQSFLFIVVISCIYAQGQVRGDCDMNDPNCVDPPYVTPAPCSPGDPGCPDGGLPCDPDVPNCRVDGKFGNWSSWSQCSKTCGGGSQSRERKCDSPPPSGIGKDCVGDHIETRECNIDSCSVDGNFTKWSEWSSCSKTCGGGIKSRSRTCDNPPPSGGGADCVGASSETMACNQKKCPVKYGKWKTVQVCEHRGITLNCGRGGVIEISYANYGRTDPNVCGYHPRTGCRAGNSRSYVYGRCHNRRSCYLKSNNSEFGDPCHGTYKYLEVKYRCRGGPYTM